MGNGLLALWHRRTASSAMAGAALCAIPLAVAVLIGFGTSLSGVAGGLSTITGGPDATPASAKTDSADPKGLNRAVSALTRKTGSAVGSNSGLSSAIGGTDRGSTGTGAGSGGSGGSGGRRVGVFYDQRPRRLWWRFLRRRLVGVSADQCPQRQPARGGWRQ